jgi:hypothetical protein
MFIPFLGTLIISFQVNIFSFDGFMKIISTFFIFLVIFGVELGIVYLYFYISNQFAEKKLDKSRRK